MAQDLQEAASAAPVANKRINAGVRLMGWLTTTDHKVIGNLYIVTAFGFFLLAGVLAMLMRAELARPGLQIVSAEQYNQLFTVHGTIMMLLFATPMFGGFANAIMPLQIGAPDVAFPASTRSPTGSSSSAESSWCPDSWCPAARPTSAGSPTHR